MYCKLFFKKNKPEFEQRKYNVSLYIIIIINNRKKHATSITFATAKEILFGANVQ